MNTFLKIIGIVSMIYGAFAHDIFYLTLGGFTVLESYINSLSEKIDELKQ
ncbi:hypothetical protein [Bacillus thuringiensis]|nr:hypothetical protein [Bacillus thuringiensis]ADH06305.1 hypothetical protein BMB171_C1489 [Bacillus thuringiensis BMB171]ADH09523.1 hypothetical protein BMB171_C4715 [Bacillus thuringiensis BMB171]